MVTFSVEFSTGSKTAKQQWRKCCSGHWYEQVPQTGLVALISRTPLSTSWKHDKCFEWVANLKFNFYAWIMVWFLPLIINSFECFYFLLFNISIILQEYALTFHVTVHREWSGVVSGPKIEVCKEEWMVISYLHWEFISSQPSIQTLPVSAAGNVHEWVQWTIASEAEDELYNWIVKPIKLKLKISPYKPFYFFLPRGSYSGKL